MRTVALFLACCQALVKGLAVPSDSHSHSSKTAPACPSPSSVGSSPSSPQSVTHSYVVEKDGYLLENTTAVHFSSASAMFQEDCATGSDSETGSLEFGYLGAPNTTSTNTTTTTTNGTANGSTNLDAKKPSNSNSNTDMIVLERYDTSANEPIFGYALSAGELPMMIARAFVGSASGGLAKLVSHPIAMQAMIFASVLTSTILFAIPVYGPFLAVGFAVIASMLGYIFGKKPRTTTADDVFTDIQSRIASMVMGVTDDIQDSQQTLANANAIQVMEEHLRMYQNAVRRKDWMSRIDALRSMRSLFQQLRASSDVFVTGEYVRLQSPYFLLKKWGTEQCFGPRRGKNGEPVFSSSLSDPYFHLWDCSVPRFKEMSKMVEMEGRVTFASDQVNMGQYCPYWNNADRWERGWLYKFSSPCEAEDIPWSNVTAVQTNDRRYLYLTSNTPNYDPGRAFLACGKEYNCPGKADDTNCHWAQNENEPLVMDQRLFAETFNRQCFTVFEKVPYIPNLPSSRVRKLLIIAPLLASLNLLTLVELDALVGEPSICESFEEARRAWKSSFYHLSQLYTQLPQHGDDLQWLTRLTKQMYKLLENADCRRASDSIRLSALTLAWQQKDVESADKFVAYANSRFDIIDEVYSNYERMQAAQKREKKKRTRNTSGN